MSRSLWIVVGAAGGIAAYRKATQLAARSRELGALGSAQAAAETTSRLAGTAAAGLSKIQDVRDRRAGRIVPGSLAAEADPAPAIAGHPVAPMAGLDGLDQRATRSAGRDGLDQRATRSTGRDGLDQRGAPSAGLDDQQVHLIPVDEDIPADWVPAATVRRTGVGQPVVVESDLAAADAERAAKHEQAAAQATARTARPRRP